MRGQTFRKPGLLLSVVVSGHVPALVREVNFIHRTKMSIRVITRSAIGQDVLSAITEIACRTEEEARTHLPSLPSAIILIVRLDSRVIKETGALGTSMSSGRVAWAVDPDHPTGVLGVVRSELRFSLLHELHHQARGRFAVGGSPDRGLMDVVVAEGLATAFARDVGGQRAQWAEYPPEVVDWVRELEVVPASGDYHPWLFDHPDGRRWIAYRAGTYLCDLASARSGLTAAELVQASTAEVLRLAGVRPPGTD